MLQKMRQIWKVRFGRPTHKKSCLIAMKYFIRLLDRCENIKWLMLYTNIERVRLLGDAP